MTQSIRLSRQRILFTSFFFVMNAILVFESTFIKKTCLAIFVWKYHHPTSLKLKRRFFHVDLQNCTDFISFGKHWNILRITVLIYLSVDLFILDIYMTPVENYSRDIGLIVFLVVLAFISLLCWLLWWKLQKFQKTGKTLPLVNSKSTLSKNEQFIPPELSIIVSSQKMEFTTHSTGNIKKLIKRVEIKQKHWHKLKYRSVA